ncbi:hypothetical protein [Cellulosilyticum ruminicola]|uniref:hypothetical protein n=1 Tax=Cellulosilyticum ruminicola TaxID=425254 RepID=UPI0006D14246|nr:hypothetical protein [Cellulosilyticum ruminicola]
MNKLEKEMKAFTFEKYPEYKDSVEKNIALSLLIQGALHTYYNNEWDTQTIEEVISKLSELILS